MGKIPQRPEDIFETFRDDIKKAFGEDLKGLILYGSGARGEYMPGRSDLNFLVILTDAGIDHLDRAFGIVSSWSKRRVAIPLFMTKSMILQSLDCYPVEFLNMQLHYVPVYGEDVLRGLAFDRSNLRLQLERELKGKLLHLRTGFLETQGKDKALARLIAVSLTAFLSLFTALLYLKGIAAPRDRRELIRETAVAAGLDGNIFEKCLDIRENTRNPRGAEALALFKSYLREVGKLCDIIDKLE
ncbi:MAG TPA: nucleotidyltransferase domain-containing protein [Syntrophales bacterium]|nr:nucleotidyltransferase domain-containing protein [Syntrophales bacterium]